LKIKNIKYKILTDKITDKINNKLKQWKKTDKTATTSLKVITEYAIKFAGKYIPGLDGVVRAYLSSIKVENKDGWYQFVCIQIHSFYYLYSNLSFKVFDIN
jgi:hypothetical protein